MIQRLRVTFAAVGPLKYVAHLDMMRTWERAIRRARLPLVYTQGFSPHARLSLAAPLPVGVTGQREMLDLWVDPPVDPDAAAARLTAAMPPGITIVAVEAVSDALPSLQSSLASARYTVELPEGMDLNAMRERVDRLLALETLAWEEVRGDKTRSYDLRATILEMAVRGPAAPGIPAALELHLSLEEGRTGRPSQVLRALDVDADGLEVIRTAIDLDQGALVERLPAPRRPRVDE